MRVSQIGRRADHDKSEEADLSKLRPGPLLRCNIEHLTALAYEYQAANTDEDAELLHRLPEVRARGCLTLEDLQMVSRWKSPRNATRIERNDESYVQEITRFALSTANERARVEALTLMDGVQWPTASVVLHFYHREPYPVLDFRALWTIGLEVPSQYDFAFWWAYVQYCRELSQESKLEMRSLDQALWQYSREYQPAEK